MKLKKVLACILASTMVMSMATVMTAGAASDGGQQADCMDLGSELQHLCNQQGSRDLCKGS